MITHEELVLARDALLERTVSYFADQPDVIGIFLGGSLPAGWRARRGELCFAQSLLDELRSHMTRLDAWIHGIEPLAPQDLKLAARVSPALANAFARSYVGLNASDIDDAVVALSLALAEQIPELHRKFELNRPLATDLFAVNLVTKRQVA